MVISHGWCRKREEKENFYMKKYTLFWSISMLLDPDPDPWPPNEYGSGSGSTTTENGNIPWVVQEARREGEFLHEKYTLFWSISMLLGPDPDPWRPNECGSGSGSTTTENGNIPWGWCRKREEKEKKVERLLRIRINLQMISQPANCMEYEPIWALFKGLSLYLEARIWVWIRIHIRVKIRIWVRVRNK